VVEAADAVAATLHVGPIWLLDEHIGDRKDNRSTIRCHRATGHTRDRRRTHIARAVVHRSGDAS
jgi:hypothetical protein